VSLIKYSEFVRIKKEKERKWMNEREDGTRLTKSVTALEECDITMSDPNSWTVSSANTGWGSGEKNASRFEGATLAEVR
jgi:hypothetical protein